MTRRQLLFVVLLNALVSLTIALAVVWVAEQRRPDPSELTVGQAAEPPVVLIATPTPAPTAAGVQNDALATVPTATPAPVNTQPDVYVVEAGDSLLGIALRFGLTLDELMEANGLENPDFVFVGQRLLIPEGTTSNVNNPAPAPAAAPAGMQLRVEQPGNLAVEAVQIINESDAAVNLQGWTLSRAGGPVYTFGDVPLFPGGSVRLHSGSGVENSLNLYWERTEPVWSSGSVVELRDASGTLVAQVQTP